MTKKIVLALSGLGANDAIHGLMSEYANALTSIGVPVVHVALDASELEYAVDRITGGEVAFALTFLGIGQDIAASRDPARAPENIWEAFRVPLLKFHGDLPAYFSDRHRDVPHNSVNLYHAKEFAHFRRRWLPGIKTLTAVVPPLPLSPIDRRSLDVSERRGGKLVFLKNGNSPDELEKLWLDRLPHSVAARLRRMAREIEKIGLKPGLLHIGDFVAEFLASEGIEPESATELLLFASAQMDDYLRRVKSLLIAKALLDLPVLVQGNLWQHVDFHGRKAQLVDGEDFRATQKVFSSQLGVIDMSANVDTWPHDRVQRAAGSFATVLTNKQGWLADNFPGFDELTFEFDHASIKSRISDVIAHPEKYLELGVAFGDRFRSLYTGAAFANFVVDIAELATLHSGSERPVIQPFFVWPGS
jgi:hypothetical protein